MLRTRARCSEGSASQLLVRMEKTIGSAPEVEDALTRGTEPEVEGVPEGNGVPEVDGVEGVPVGETVPEGEGTVGQGAAAGRMYPL